MFIPEEGSFSLSAYVESPGYQRVIPRGFLVSKRDGETWVAPLIPQLFYGVGGEQLRTWRQWIPSTGEQTILSRVAGEPSVPREELYWRRVTPQEEEAAEAAVAWDPVLTVVVPLVVAAAAAVIVVSLASLLS